MNKKLVIAGSRSGVGKTTIALGLMAALKNRGLNIQPFKVGPDYIDPGFHTLVCANNSYNLDSYFLEEAGVRACFDQKSKKADISIIEGVMGLFDGKGRDSVSSTAEIAKTLNSPVILIIDASKIAQSAAAVVYGYKNYDPKLNLKGLIINNITSPRHYKLLKEAVKAKMSDLEILGYLPKNRDLELAERHLGLVPVTESRELKSYIQKLINLMEEYIDLDKVLEISSQAANTAAGLKKEAKRKLDNKVDNKLKEKNNLWEFKEEFKNKITANKIKLGVAFDQAFNFYYQLNLDILKAAGAELIYISPLNDKELRADLDALYLGGGFPESFLKELAENISFKNDLKAKIKAGLPVYAECGGLMYLSSAVKNFADQKYKMLDIISAEIEMTDKLQEMGYREVESLTDNLLFQKGEQARGHVFHYSKITQLAAEIKKNYFYQNQKEGYSSSANVLASYLHLHFGSNLKPVQNFLLKALAYKKSRSV